MLAALLASCGASCVHKDDRLPGSPPRPAAPLTAPTRLCVTLRPRTPCRGADEVERWLQDPDLEILGVAAPPAGIQGVKVLTLRAPGPAPVVFRAKWRSDATTTPRSNPRWELAAHAVQKLFLEPHQYVVPPAAAHCFPIGPYRELVEPAARPTFGDTGCVFGVLSYWLEHVQTLPDAGRAGWFDWEGGALDPGLFRKDPLYRDSVASMNLVTFLIAHGDTHWKNFLIGDDPHEPIVYTVDNSLAFGAKKNSRLRQDWSLIRVPALPRDRIDRLRAAATGALASVATLAELEMRGGRLVPVPVGEPTTLPGGLTWDGKRLRVRMTDAEMDGLRRRLAALLARVDRGSIAVY